MTKAFAYMRTSSAANVGADKDSERRQREAIDAFAAANGIEIVDSFYDAAVKGTDAIEDRPGFSALLTRIESNGVRAVIVEDSSRLARSVLVNELAIALLIKRGVRVLDSRGDDLTATDDPTRTAMRQVVAAFSQLEKARLVAKLKGARDRKSAAAGRRIEGNHKGYDRVNPELVAVAHSLKDGRSLRQIAGELEARGYVTAAGKRFLAGQVARLLAYPAPVASAMIIGNVAADADELGAIEARAAS